MRPVSGGSEGVQLWPGWLCSSFSQRGLWEKEPLMPSGLRGRRSSPSVRIWNGTSRAPSVGKVTSHAIACPAGALLGRLTRAPATGVTGRRGAQLGAAQRELRETGTRCSWGHTALRERSRRTAQRLPHQLAGGVTTEREILGTRHGGG